MTGDLDVYVSSQDLELVEVRKSLEFAEIRRRLQDAEVELVKLRQSAPKCGRSIAAHQITASDLMNTFTNTFLINIRMKCVTTTT